ncbi:MAG: ferric reductase-like transmembrane domain-containing protein [Anaeromyxobacter sp.]|nr:ferric reductase-like transmembrane domain-containing protein [Anaeromyxobacter sp.]MBL0275125.1 ferric reductase-like transmembrane domain-containing protein [Anaeromyxobacter sp.]
MALAAVPSKAAPAVPAAPRAGPPGSPAPAPRRRWLQPLALAACAAPLLKLAADGATGGLGANPIEAGLSRLGFWTLTLLCLTLAATPLHQLAGLAWPLRLRRLLGLATFAYATLHFLWYLGVDQGLELGLVATDVVKRPFITVGFAALLLLAPLALTSTDGWVRRLGFRAWKRLHRLTYAAALLGVVHFAWRVKADRLVPSVFAAVLAALLLARLATWARRQRP